VPFKPDPALSQPGKLGPGIPEEFSLPYRSGFGTNPNNPVQYDLSETFQFIRLCGDLGVKILNLSAGSPYYNPHIQRPAAYPPSDGYQPPEDPLVGVARQMEVVRELKAKAPATIVIVGSAYSYLQEYLPHVAQAAVRQGWTDMIGLGRMVLAYPTLFADAFQNGTLSTKSICRTFSDCTTAPRNGMISGCYPLDKYYAAKPEFQKIKEIKKRLGS
jgi:2,4-dienoyl-CoA reductase-like NADH-dependent reductase (Old Yellow Enzyme family)